MTAVGCQLFLFDKTWQAVKVTGRTTAEWCLRACTGEWAEKLRRYTRLTEHTVKSNPKKAIDPAVIVSGEAERVLKLLDPKVKAAVGHP